MRFYLIDLTGYLLMASLLQQFTVLLEGRFEDGYPRTE